MTPLDILTQQLRAAGQKYNSGVEVPPVAVVWTDPDAEWNPIVPTLMAELPELLILGEYLPDQRQGPVIWLKTVLAGKVPGMEPTTERPPIFYLPGVSRHELRHADQCRAEYQPLCELLYRGNPWSQVNGKDWTVEAFFSAANGLNLDLAQDKATRQSLHSALATLITTPLEKLGGKRVQAGDLDTLVVEDTPRDLLMWIAQGENKVNSWAPQYFQAFRSRCRDEYDFDPAEKVPVEVARELGNQNSQKWKALWSRFKQSPGHYQGISEQLENAMPTDELPLDSEPWPQENRKKEGELRQAFSSCAKATSEDTRDTIRNLESHHGERRSWVWASLGDAPLAAALIHLAKLAEFTRSIPDFQTLEDSIAWYTGSGYTADRAVLQALATVYTATDKLAVTEVIRHIYGPWLDTTARNFERLASKTGYPAPKPYEVGEGECLVFVDGMRFDLGKRLFEELTDADYEVTISHRLAALPSVTATAKPAVIAVGDAIKGKQIPSSFAPETEDGKELNHARFHKILKSAGLQVLSPTEFAPAAPQARGWSEIGKVDKRGHDLQEDLAKQIGSEIDAIRDWVTQLFTSGWQKVTLVTDHGWLLLPGGLQKTNLPAFLTESRWSRCAAIKGQSVPDTPVAAWHWNQNEHVAIAPGASSFRGGLAYSHGGISPQECVLPVLTVQCLHGASPSAGIVITGITWRRQRCRIRIENATSGLRSVLRTTASDPKSKITPEKEIETDGECSLLVTDEDFFGESAQLVILSPEGSILMTRATTVGG